jgi:hypothetical protein
MDFAEVGSKTMPSYQKDVALFKNANEAKQFYASPRVTFFMMASALFTGILIGGIVTLISWRYLDDGRPFVTFLITALSVALIVWFRLSSWTLHQLGLIPPKTAGPATIIVKSEDGRQQKLYEFESVTDDEVEKITKQVRRWGSLSQRSLKTLIGNRTVWFIDEILDRGLIEWKNPNEHRDGMIITDEGWDFFANKHEINLSPTSEVHDVRE